MSLIQQALEKTHRTKGGGPAGSPSFKEALERDSMGASLERELTQVQESYARRRKLYRMIFLGVLGLCFVAGAGWIGIQYGPFKTKTSPKAAVAVFHAPLRISSGAIFRLTGITRINGRPMAVINEEIVGVGDLLPGRAVVKTIGDGKVQLDIQGRDIQLVL